MRSLCSLLALSLLLISITTTVHGGSEPRKLDENIPGTTEKCTPCEEEAPPPPPPPVPCPPPPALPPPPPALPPPSPPPPKKTPTPSSSNCPPPPSAYIYIQGPPGSLYPIDQDFSGAARGSLSGLLVGLALLGLLVCGNWKW